MMLVMRGVFALAALTACSFRPGHVGPHEDDASVDIDAVADPPLDATVDTFVVDVGPDAASCPSDFSRIGTSYYKGIATPAAYLAAVQTCAALGANVHLARLDNQTELDAIYALMDAAVTGTDTHTARVVGQRHANGAGAADDTWHDLDDTTPLPFLPWGAGEPTNGTGENCMTVRKEYDPATNVVTGADDCTTPRPFPCECQ